MRGGIVSAIVDTFQSHLQLGETSSQSYTETGCCHRVSWLINGTSLPEKSCNNRAEEVRLGT